MTSHVCPYRHRCRLAFDFSDHIVLNIVQYIIPCMLETHYSLTLLWSATRADASSGESSISWERRRGGRWAPVAALCTAATICGFSFRSMLLTCTFFHTLAENVVGLVLAVSVAFLPFLVGGKDASYLWTTKVVNDDF